MAVANNPDSKSFGPESLANTTPSASTAGMTSESPRPYVGLPPFEAPPPRAPVSFRGLLADRAARVCWAAAAVLLAVATLGAIFQPPYPDPYAELGGSDGWLYPVERNGFRRLPYFSVRLRDLVVPDGRTVLAVGDSGTILKSSDGGESWTSKASGSTETLTGIVSAGDGAVVAAGSNGSILRSGDQGESWRPVDGVGKENLAGLSGDGDALWAFGAKGTVLRSVDGGKSWQKAAAPFDADVAFAMSDRDAVLAIGAHGQIAMSADQGKTWKVKSSGVTADLAVANFDGQTIWVGGSGGTLLKSSNAGDTWTAVKLPVDVDIRDIKALAGTLWLVGSHGAILKSTDGGSTWQTKETRTTAILEALAAPSGTQDMWAVGESGLVLKSRNGGENWRPKTAGPREIRVVVADLGRQTIWLAGRSGVLMTSADGGGTWRGKQAGTTDLLEVAVSADGRIVLAVGDGPAILRSADGGGTWQKVGIPGPPNLGSVAITADGRTAWATGDRGLVIKSVDGGVTWRVTYQGTAPLPFSRISASRDGTIVWAAGFTEVIVSTDGGEHWRPALKISGLSGLRHNLAVSSDGRMAWAASDGDGVQRTVDLGATWQRNTGGSPDGLRSIVALDDLRTLWSLAKDNTVFMSTDAGESWQKMGSVTHPGATCWNISANPDGSRLWVTCRTGLLRRSDDSGATWKDPVEPYGRWPARWFYGAMAVVAFLAFVPILRRRDTGPVRTVERILDLALSDKPVDAARDDRLGFAALVDALSRFLRNKGTQPPLVMAITAPWGQGKSSIMSMLRNDLRRNGRDTVWFNAWHHQKEDHLLASLLAEVRAASMPPWWRLAGIEVRWRLYWARLGRHPVAALLSAALLLVPLGMLLADMLGMAQELHYWVDWANKALVAKSGVSKEKVEAFSAPHWLGAFSTVVGLAWTLWLGRNRLKGSAVDPARLLAMMSSNAKVKDLDAQLSFRHRFAREFKEATDALGPRTLTIFIDDLDRCRPEAVGETLEAVNFLVSSGSCYVILGYFREHVERAVGLHFSAIASELRLGVVDGAAAQAPAVSDEHARRQRREYARFYLQKLVQIEVPVPKLDDDNSARLFQQQSAAASANPAAAADQSRWSRTRDFVTTYATRWGATMAVAAVLFGFVAAGFLGAIMLPAHPVTDDRRPPPVAASSNATKPSGTIVGSQSGPNPPDRPTDEVTTRPGDPARWPWQVYLAALLGCFGVFVFAAVRLQRQLAERTVVRDSDDFINAVDLWKPVLRTCLSTPREVKRFLNEVRFFAARAAAANEAKRAVVSDAAVVGLAGTRIVDQYVRHQVDMEDIPPFYRHPYEWQARFRSRLQDSGNPAALRPLREVTDEVEGILYRDYQAHGWHILPNEQAAFAEWSDGVRIRT